MSWLRVTWAKSKKWDEMCPPRNPSPPQSPPPTPETLQMYYSKCLHTHLCVAYNVLEVGALDFLRVLLLAIMLINVTKHIFVEGYLLPE